MSLSLRFNRWTPDARQQNSSDWPLHRPLVASLLAADQVEYGQWQFAVESVEFDDEKAAITRIDELLGGKRCVTFNGKGFDLPVLALTAMRASAFNCRNLTDAWMSHRFSGSHIDVADLISCFGAAPRVSLEMLCEAAAIPVKTQGHGSDVAEMLRDQGLRAVSRYCEEDVASTLILFAQSTWLAIANELLTMNELRRATTDYDQWRTANAIA